MGILKPKTKEALRMFSVRLPAELVGQVEALRANAEAVGHTLDLADIVSKALAAAVKSGRAELAEMAAPCIHTAAVVPAVAPAALAPSTHDSGRRDTSGASVRRESGDGSSIVA